MDTEPFSTHEFLHTGRTVYHHEREEEDRKDDHMEELRYEATEYSGNLAHSCHKLGVTKIQNINFSPK